MTNQFHNLQRTVGRPKKQIKINRSISVNFNDYKAAITLMKSGYSMTKVTTLLDGALSMSEVIAIRSYAVKNAILPMKRSTLKGHETRSKKATSNGTVIEPKKEMAKRSDLFDSAGITVNTAQAEVTEVAEITEVVESVSMQPLQEAEVFSDMPSSKGRTLTIDFKGIMMHVQISSIVVGEDLIVVR